MDDLINLLNTTSQTRPVSDWSPSKRKFARVRAHERNRCARWAAARLRSKYEQPLWIWKEWRNQRADARVWCLLSQIIAHVR